MPRLDWTRLVPRPSRSASAMANRQPRVVAELGRPETPEETAARKAENSRRHRANQTTFNLVIATLASLAVVLFIVLVVVRPTPAEPVAVDYAATAAEAQGGASETLVVPVLPQGWVANAARFDRRAEVLTWYVGFITPGEQFAALNQGIDANPTWQASVLDNAVQTGTVTIDGITWAVYDRRNESETGNNAYALAAAVGDSTFVLHGTASDSEFEALASAIATELD